jgi:hypothetical protein
VAKQTVVKVYEWCDIHLTDKGENVEASFTQTFTVGRLTRSLALCEDCEDGTVSWKELAEMVQKYGTKPDSELAHGPLRPAARARVLETGEQHFCPIDSCERHERPYLSRSGLRDHVRETHNTTLSELGLSKRKENLNGPYICDVQVDGKPCGHSTPRPQGLGVHKRLAHGIEGTSHAAVAARAARAS